MSSRDLIAPIGFYDRLFWLAAFLVLAFIFTTLGPAMFEAAQWPLLFLFIMAGFFFATWWIGVQDPEKPPLEFLVARIGLGFLLGLGGLWCLLFFMQTVFQLSTLWGIPVTPPALAAMGTSGAILLQFGVGAVEEGVFRVALPRLLLARGLNPLSVLLLANWIFGLFHWRAYQGNLPALLVAVFAGMLQSLALFMSRSAIGIMLSHALWNIHAAGLLGGFLLYLAWGLLLIGGLYYLKLKKWKVKLPW